MEHKNESHAILHQIWLFISHCCCYRCYYTLLNYIQLWPLFPQNKMWFQMQIAISQMVLKFHFLHMWFPLCCHLIRFTAKSSSSFSVHFFTFYIKKLLSSIEIYSFRYVYVSTSVRCECVCECDCVDVVSEWLTEYIYICEPEPVSMSIRIFFASSRKKEKYSKSITNNRGLHAHMHMYEKNPISYA